MTLGGRKSWKFKEKEENGRNVKKEENRKRREKQGREKIMGFEMKKVTDVQEEGKKMRKDKGGRRWKKQR